MLKHVCTQEAYVQVHIAKDNKCVYVTKVRLSLHLESNQKQADIQNNSTLSQGSLLGIYVCDIDN